MKKASAFAVFKSKKGNDESSQLERSHSTRSSIKKASSTPAISDGEKKSSRIIRAITGGSFRATIRGNKHRPSSLTNGSGESPFVAGDNNSVKLTGVKEKKGKSPKAKKNKFVATPVPAVINKVSSVSKKDIESLKKLTQEESVDVTATPVESSLNTTNQGSASGKRKAKPKRSNPPLAITDLEDTPRIRKPHPGEEEEEEREELEDVSDRNGSICGAKRALEEKSISPEKKKRRTMSPKMRLVQQVTPQRKGKLWPSVELDYMYDSQEEAKKFFECMIYPVSTEKFFSELWEKKPLLVRRRNSSYNEGWFSTEELDKILEEEQIEFGKHLDVTTYKDGKRETHNPPGRAHRSVVWDFYQNDCSIRMLNPQTFSKNVWKNLSVLQEYFGCCVGANVYLTPPGTQGFAPHYDDIEAFILQLEGKKHWRVYNPRNEGEKLPRFSSGNFDESEIGSPILDTILNPGDLLYFPRGIIHQGRCLEDSHSLHITVSCYQKNTWGDLLEQLLPAALSIAIEEDVEFREGLPRDYGNYMGVVHYDSGHPERDVFSKKVASLMTKLIQNHLPIDAACDQMGRKFMHDSLPPVLTEAEKSCSVYGQGGKWDPVTMTVKGEAEIEPDTMIKLIRKGALRMASENDTVRIYYGLENARVYHGKEEQYMEIPTRLAPDVEHLIHAYPEYTKVESLPSVTLDDKIEISNLLYEQGLIVTGEPLDEIHTD